VVGTVRRTGVGLNVPGDTEISNIVSWSRNVRLGKAVDQGIIWRDIFSRCGISRS
jgi:hypothetical protein